MQTSADRPRFRQDLVAEPIEDGGSKFIDVMDPDSGVLYRFYEVEYSLACAMDGQRDVPGIVRWAEEELGLKPKPDEVRMVISTLGELGYLEGAGAAAAATAPAAAASAPAAAPAAKPTAPSAAAARPAEPPSRPTPPPKPVGKATPVGGTPARATPAGGTPAAKPAEQAAFNRWDQPTAMGDVDEYLQPGVVAGGRAATPTGAEVELGAPGARREQSDELPRAPELELGKPGAAAASRGAPASKGADIALGASGAAGVSVDLADHVDVGAADVKEAVRASQVMKAVDVPPELAAEAEKPAAKPAAKVEAKPAEKPAAKPAEKAAEKPAAKPAEKAAEKPAAKPAEKAAEKPAAKPAEKAAEKPAAKPVEKRPSVAPPAPRTGVSPVLIAALVIAILAAGGFAVYKYVLKKKTVDTSTSVQTPPVPPKKPEPPPPPPVETQKLATEQAPAEELKPSGPGQVATIVANDTVVKAGDPVAKLVGFKSLEADVANLDKAITKAKTDSAAAEKERDAAQAAGNKAGVTTAEKKLTAAQKALEDGQKKLTDKQAALDKFLIKAPAAGKVTAVAKANQKITPTDVVATLTRDPVLVATFKKADGATQDAPVLLAVKGSDQKLACNVVTAAAEGTKIACPKDAAPEGSEVTYAGVDTSRPATPPAGETPATPEQGSAAGSAATPPAGGDKAGSAAAPEAGSAEPKAEKVAPKAPPRPRPRPAPHPKATPDKTGGDAGGDKAGSAAPAPAPAPTPAPAGSGGGLQ